MNASAKRQRMFLNRLSPLSVFLLYILAGGLWIFISDNLLMRVAPEAAAVARIQTLKGLLYVLVTALLLYWLLSRYQAQQERDISEQKRAEAERMRILSILEASRNEIYTFDPGTLRFAYVNVGALNNLGYTAEEMLAMTPLDLKPEYTESSFRALLAPLLRGEEEKVVFRTIHRRSGGTVYPVEVNMQLIEQKGVRNFLAVILDITDRIKLEAQLLHARKMEAVGLLAGGVAHDFNNVLTAIIGYAHILQIAMKDNTVALSHIENILAACERAARLTRSLLAFSRKQIIHPVPIDLNAAIRRIENLLRRLIGERIELRMDTAALRSTILADSSQLKRVLLNLAANARDAMPSGGTITILTDNMHMDDEFIRSAGFGRPGAYARLTMRDTGTGMDEKTRERIFEPFFPTKPAGKGTGMGLSMAYGVIKQHGGFIACTSSPGNGAVFELFFPLSDAEAAQEQQQADRTEPPRGSEAVLIAEDDQDVRSLMSRVLGSYGYRVLEAPDGEEAVRLFRESDPRPDLAILDVVMPKKNGREACEEIRRIAPGTKVIFISGYRAEPDDEAGPLCNGHPVISKPLSPQQILRLVREMLDRPAPDSGA